MIAKTETFEIRTPGRGSYEITDEVTRIVRATGLKEGIVTVFVRHTSASLVIYENADPSARRPKPSVTRGPAGAWPLPIRTTGSFLPT